MSDDAVRVLARKFAEKDCLYMHECSLGNGVMGDGDSIVAAVEKAIRLTMAASLGEAADYVSQHDNCGDIASKEIRDLEFEPADILAEITRRLDTE